jgi:ribosomal protein L16/L10AE
MFEVGGLPADIAVAALKSAQYKFSIRTKVVARHTGGE